MAKKIRSRVVGRKAAERVADVAGGMVVPELQIFIGLALFAGIITGALLGPAVRIVRSYNMCVRPLSWGGDFVGVSEGDGSPPSPRSPSPWSQCLRGSRRSLELPSDSPTSNTTWSGFVP